MRNFDPIEYSNYNTIRHKMVYSIKKLFPRILSEIVLPEGQMKDQQKPVQISCNICYFHQAHALPTTLISLPICL